MDASDAGAGIREYLDGLIETLRSVDTAPLGEMARMILDAQEAGGCIFTMGNGGHANTAAHMINDIAKHTISSDDKTAVVADSNRFRIFPVLPFAIAQELYTVSLDAVL